MKQQVVVLAITYDESEIAPPSQWDWTEIVGYEAEVQLTGTLVPMKEV